MSADWSLVVIISACAWTSAKALVKAAGSGQSLGSYCIRAKEGAVDGCSAADA